MGAFRKAFASIVIIIILVLSFMAFLYVSTPSDSAWIFGHPDMTVNRTVTNNITYDVVTHFNNWHDIYHSSFAIKKIKIHLLTSYVDNSGNWNYSDYMYSGKLSSVTGNNYPVRFIDKDNDGYLSIGDEFISDPSMLNVNFDKFWYSLDITVDGQSGGIVMLIE